MKKQMLLNDETERIKARESRSVRSLDGSPIVYKEQAIPSIGAPAKSKSKPKTKSKKKEPAGVLSPVDVLGMLGPQDVMEIIRQSQIQQAMDAGTMGPRLGEYLRGR